MKSLSFSIKYAGIGKSAINRYSKKLIPEIRRMNFAASIGYLDERGSINLPYDDTMHKQVNHLIRKIGHVDYAFVIGMGGSTLGAQAIYNALRNDDRLIFIDTIDPEFIKNKLELFEAYIKQKKKVLVIAISKSGSTTETVANFEIFVEKYSKLKKNYRKNVVVIADECSTFWQFAKLESFNTLTIPKKVGGRYSAFSAVGLFPLGVVGINIKQLLLGAKAIRKQCLSMKINKNPAALSALLIYINCINKKNIHNTFLFLDALEFLGKWYLQLSAESLGKLNASKKRIKLMPIYSIGPQDLHSLVQMFLGGADDKYTTFVTVKSPIDINVPKLKNYDLLIKNIQGKSLHTIKDAIYKGVLKAYIKNKKNFNEISLPTLDEASLGQFLQLKMMEIMYLGALLKVNPFNQPNVEHYKEETRKLLKNK